MPGFLNLAANHNSNCGYNSLMTQLLNIHPVDPQRRLISQAVEVLKAGGLIVYPTDSCYALGFRLEARQAMQSVQRIRNTGRNHNFTLICNELSEISAYAKLENWSYRILKAHIPGPYTFVLKATRDVPRRLQNPRRKTIGIRFPDHKVVSALLAAMDEPMMSSTLLLPGDELPLNDAYEIVERLGNEVDVVIDGGPCGVIPSTVVDLTGDYPLILRHGKGDTRNLE